MSEKKNHVSDDELEQRQCAMLYQETLQRIKETDNISFKLLGLVPLLSGASIIGLVAESEEVPLLVSIVAGWLGGLVTYSIFRWELRNIQICEQLRALAKALEEALKMPYYKIEGIEDKPWLGKLELRPTLIKGEFNKNGWGKTQAERYLYWTVIISWMLFPILAWAYKLSSSLPYSAYFMKVPIITLGIHILAAVFFWTVQIYGFRSSNSEE